MVGLIVARKCMVWMSSLINQAVKVERRLGGLVASLFDILSYLILAARHHVLLSPSSRGSATFAKFSSSPSVYKSLRLIHAPFLWPRYCHSNTIDYICTFCSNHPQDIPPLPVRLPPAAASPLSLARHRPSTEQDPQRIVHKRRDEDLRPRRV